MYIRLYLSIYLSLSLSPGRDVESRESGVDGGQREHPIGDVQTRKWCGVLLTLVSCCPRSLRDLPPYS